MKFDEHHLSGGSADRVEFKVTTNPGQPLQPIAKSRVGRTVAHCAGYSGDYRAQNGNMALIFDEVDVGISGPTAAVVGKLLR